MWIDLSETATIDKLLNTMPKDFIIFKHSFRCTISGAIKKRLEKSIIFDKFDIFLIDVIQSRPTSLYLAEKANVNHESPQVLLFKDGQCVFHASHFDITEQSILAAAK